MLTGKTVVLGVTGGIAAYKAVEVASQLTQAGARVRVVMTGSAGKFIGPLTFHTITRQPVVTDIFELSAESSAEHVALGEAADVVVIAPATANTIAKLAHGLADDILSCTVLATTAPVVLAPAMNVNMFQNQATQENLAKLEARGFTVVAPAHGRLASGRVGRGRLAELENILGTIRQVLGQHGDLAGRQVVVTAGGTQEPVDPVRHLGNRSSGKMGYALAEAARDRGARVKLIAAPVALADPAGVEVIHVQTAAEMKTAVDRAVKGADALIMTAAVADYRPEEAAPAKIKKENQELTLKLVRTPDILTEVRGKFIRVGFAAESDNLLANARQKLHKKQLDIIVANDITAAGSTFGSDTNQVTLIDREGKVAELPLLSKREVAEKILDRVVGLLTHKSAVISVKDYWIKHRRIQIPLSDRKGLPLTSSNKFELVTDAGTITTKLARGGQVWLGVGKWFQAHPELKAGDRLVITVVKPEKRYRLEIVKG
ncbi:MAG: bifunctional phosphopantothenoylcysteine decarboxylase/phosphopantothenate--cysteine ligase CoaBC [Chloroflexota bacterium]